MGLFGPSRKRKTSLAARVRKLENKVAKKERVANLKKREEALRKKLRGY